MQTFEIFRESHITEKNLTSTLNVVDSVRKKNIDDL